MCLLFYGFIVAFDLLCHSGEEFVLEVKYFLHPKIPGAGNNQDDLLLLCQGEQVLWLHDGLVFIGIGFMMVFASV